MQHISPKVFNIRSSKEEYRLPISVENKINSFFIAINLSIKQPITEDLKQFGTVIDSS